MALEKKLPFTLSHAPSSLAECVGNDLARDELRKWAVQWQTGNVQKPMLLNGPSGVGKTAAARALAIEMGWVLVETSAGDLRDKEKIKRIYGLGGASSGLFGERRLLLFDELDSAIDRGAIPELLGVLRSAKQPLVLIANDAWDPKLVAVRALTKMVDFKAVNASSIKSVLRKISQEEKSGSIELIDVIASECRGDLRSAINDLQAGFASVRERKSNVFAVVGKIFKTMSYSEAVRAGDESEVDFDLLKRWIEENIAAEYESAEEIAKAFDSLSRADLFAGRKIKRQYYGLYKYERALTLAGVALAKKQRYAKFTRYAFPSVIKTLSASRAARQSLNALAGKTRLKLHCSRKEALDSLAFLSQCNGLSGYLELEENEAESLGEVYPTAKKR